MRPQNSRCHNLYLLSQETLLRKHCRERGADHPTATELKAEPTPRQTCWHVGGLARPASPLLLTAAGWPPQVSSSPGRRPSCLPHFTSRLLDHFNLKRFLEALLAGGGMRDECWPTGAGPEEVPSTARWSWGKLGLLRGTEERGKSRGLGVTQNCLQIPCVSPTAVWPREVSPSQPPCLSCA